THLDLSDNLVGDAGAEALAASPHLGDLTRLELSANRIGAAGAAALAASSLLHNLGGLDLAFNRIPLDLVLELFPRSRPGCVPRIGLMGNHPDGEPTGQRRPRPDRRGLSGAAFAIEEQQRWRRAGAAPRRLSGPERWEWPWR